MVDFANIFARDALMLEGLVDGRSVRSLSRMNDSLSSYARQRRDPVHLKRLEVTGKERKHAGREKVESYT